jgi:diacylglycerol kinase family enzyme
MPSALIIRNPASRRQLKPQHFDASVDLLRAVGWTVTIAITEHEGHATAFAREAARNNIDVVIANGGDGTINEIINGLAGSQTALAVIPAGTANVWAHEARIPKDPAKAVQIALTGDRRRVDLGLANGRYFLLMAGIGLDAAIIPRVNPWLKRRAGALAYILAGVLTALRTKPWPASVLMDGSQPPLEESPWRPAVQPSDTLNAVDQPPPATSHQPPATTVYWMVAGNTRNYGGLVDITHQARIDDGLLDAVIMRGGGLHLIPDGIRLLFHRLRRSPNITCARAGEIAIDTPGIPVQLDGERCLETPLRLTVAPAALTVIVPRGLRSPLFSRVA